VPLGSFSEDASEAQGGGIAIATIKKLSNGRGRLLNSVAEV
jgi:hypothetical protein